MNYALAYFEQNKTPFAAIEEQFQGKHITFDCTHCTVHSPSHVHAHTHTPIIISAKCFINSLEKTFYSPTTWVFQIKPQIM